ISALLIDVEEHQQILPKLSSLNSENYIKLVKNLRIIQKSCLDIKCVYTMVTTNEPNIWRFVGDSDPKEPAVPGYKYDVSKYPEMIMSLKHSSVDKEFTTDECGIWLSGYAPIKNKDGKTIAIIGIDMSAESVYVLQSILKTRFWLINIFGIFLSIFLSWFLSRSIFMPILKIIKATNIVAEGNFNYNIEEIKNNKEINTLIVSFNTMSSKLKESYQKLQNYFLSIIQSFFIIIEAKNPYIHGHSERVAEYALKIAEELNLSEEEIKIIKNIAKLHDIGKVLIAEEILQKPKLLNKEEWAQIKKHPEMGINILKPFKLTNLELSLIKHHHERFDGTGYPNGLKEEQIPLIVRIITVADAFDSMNSDRSYRKALDKKNIIKELNKNSGTQFDSKIVKVFLKILEKNDNLFHLA
ncbi:MAG: HD domain-containing phosphohydrolase, partial [bacterium]